MQGFEISYDNWLKRNSGIICHQMFKANTFIMFGELHYFNLSILKKLVQL